MFPLALRLEAGTEHVHGPEEIRVEPVPCADRPGFLKLLVEEVPGVEAHQFRGEGTGRLRCPDERDDSVVRGLVMARGRFVIPSLEAAQLASLRMMSCAQARFALPVCAVSFAVFCDIFSSVISFS